MRVNTKSEVKSVRSSKCMREKANAYEVENTRKYKKTLLDVSFLSWNQKYHSAQEPPKQIFRWRSRDGHPSGRQTRNREVVALACDYRALEDLEGTHQHDNLDYQGQGARERSHSRTRVNRNSRVALRGDLDTDRSAIRTQTRDD